MTIVYEYPIIAPFVSILLAEVLKFMIDFFKRRAKLRFVSPGGMPSGHSAFVGSLVVLVAFVEGVNSLGFAISAVLALIVMYDAIHLRYEVGRHAAVLNKIDPKFKLEDSLGHTHLEVIVGALFGAFVTFLLLF